jgi:hypothetical protein
VGWFPPQLSSSEGDTPRTFSRSGTQQNEKAPAITSDCLTWCRRPLAARQSSMALTALRRQPNHGSGKWRSGGNPCPAGVDNRGFSPSHRSWGRGLLPSLPAFLGAQVISSSLFCHGFPGPQLPARCWGPSCR